MTIRLTTDRSATAHIVRASGGGVVVPSHVGDLLATQASGDSEQFSQLSRNYPRTAAALRGPGWSGAGPAAVGMMSCLCLLMIWGAKVSGGSLATSRGVG